MNFSIAQKPNVSESGQYQFVQKQIAPALPLGGRWCSLSELLQQSDIVSLRLPLATQSANLMKAKTFGLMKPGSSVINTAQGSLVDKAALLDTLLKLLDSSDHLRGPILSGC